MVLWLINYLELGNVTDADPAVVEDGKLLALRAVVSGGGGLVGDGGGVGVGVGGGRKTKFQVAVSPHSERGGIYFHGMLKSN